VKDSENSGEHESMAPWKSRTLNPTKIQKRPASPSRVTHPVFQYGGLIPAEPSPGPQMVRSCAPAAW
jgi:hypothetical protein